MDLQRRVSYQSQISSSSPHSSVLTQQNAKLSKNGSLPIGSGAKLIKSKFMKKLIEDSKNEGVNNSLHQNFQPNPS